MDIFGGSGTVAEVARDLDRSSISIELNPDYVKLIRKRLKMDQQLDTGIYEYETRVIS
jgi:DNA modification methylase